MLVHAQSPELSGLSHRSDTGDYLRPVNEPRRSFSSRLMTVLLKWRNPDGEEETWFVEKKASRRNICKVLGTQVALHGLAVVAVVETVASVSLALIAGGAEGKGRLFQLCAKNAQSSAFTILWAVSNGFLSNSVESNLYTNESLSRHYAHRYLPVSWRVYRDSDRLLCADWFKAHVGKVKGIRTYDRLDSVIAFKKKSSKERNLGKKLLIAFAEKDPSFKKALVDRSANLHTFLLAKSIWAYVGGSRQDDEILDIFKLKTWVGIYRTREKFHDLGKKEREEVDAAFSSYESFDPQLETLKKIVKIGTYELQGGIFLTECWKAACESYSTQSE